MEELGCVGYLSLNGLEVPTRCFLRCAAVKSWTEAQARERVGPSIDRLRRGERGSIPQQN